MNSLHKKIIFLLLISYAQRSYSNWLCRKASSKADNNIFYACGYAEGEILNEVRNNARDNAKEEFNSFCQESENCKERAYIISPMRTECFKENSIIKCYRGLEYRILPTKRSSIQFDKEKIQGLIAKKEKELDQLQGQIQSIEQLEELNTKIDSIESDLDTLKSQNSSQYDDIPVTQQNISFGLGLTNAPLEYGDESLSAINLEYGLNLIGPYMAVNIGTSYLFSTQKKDDVFRGSPNSYSAYEYYNHKGFELYLTLPISYNKWSIIPEFGHISLNYAQERYLFNEFGVKAKTEKSTENFNSSFKGLHLRYGEKYFIQYGLRYFPNGSSNNLKVGVSIDF